MECKSWLYWVSILLMMVHIVVAGQRQGYSCIEEERKALLQIKASHMKSYDTEIDHFLPTWVDFGNSTPANGGGDCCDWERVNCNSTTRHVTHLSLDRLRGVDVYMYDWSNLWTLNVSLFLHFKELRSLNLSYDFLDRKFLKTGLESLKKLEVLDLSGNRDIDNDILPSLTALTSLKILDLSYTGLNGNFPISDFAALDNLETLDLSHCGLNGTFDIQGSERVSILSKLKTLNLGDNRFNSSVITSLNTVSSVTSLDLSSNPMSGPFPAQDFAALENLEMLDLTDCGFNGTFEIQGSERVSILRNLKTLKLGSNFFNESVITSLKTFSSLKSLDLSRNPLPLSGPFPAQELSHLTNLEELDLSDTHLNDTPNIQACQSLSRLKRLESLDLSYNYNFNKSIVSCLTALPSLKTLHLSSAFAWGSSFPDQEFLNFSDLEVLLLIDNGFSGTIPMEAFSSFHHLEVLDLSYNNLVGSIPSSILSLSSLRALSFADNNFNGSLSDHGFCESKNLDELELSGNMLDGTLPQCWNNLSSLKFLDISLNRFTGKLVPSVIASLTSLEYIDFSDNMFEGSFSFSSFSNHTNLEVVRFGSDNDKFEVETEEPLGWIPVFQLEVLQLSNCNMKIPKGHVLPGFLLHQHKLLKIDMSHNSLEGHLPNWLIKNNTNLEEVILSNNFFCGMPLYRNVNMKVLDISGNIMIGTIPDNIPNFFPNIYLLNLSMNALSGVIPSSIGELQYLDLSDNVLSGEVPKGLLTNISRLSLLKLSNNKLHGQVLSGNLSWGYLEYVYLDSNNFTGEIGTKNSEERLENISVLDISNNLFTGVIPAWISNMSWLSELVVRNNSFEGGFPCGVAPLSFLDISYNSFSGPIPSCLNLQYIEHLLLGSNKLTGSIPNSFGNLTELLTLDIGNNNLSGTIPKFLGQLSSLRILLLRKNNLSGSIPKQLCQLRNVSFIDLSNNSLSGSVPSCLQNITGPTDLAFFKQWMMNSPIDYPFQYRGILQGLGVIYGSTNILKTQDEVQYTTKRIFLSYTGGILDYMTGLDFSCNKLTGQIPQELGFLSQLCSLNLSHNQLTGPIPVSFSNLAKIESLDLSSNGLTGEVPSGLVKLNSLSAFNASHNNLSGRLPPFTAQFGTFTEASYEGNPLLCGPPLKKKCTTDSQVTNPLVEEEDNEKWYDIDMACFYGSSSSACFVVLLGILAVLYIKPQWRRRWLDWVENCMFTFYYFLYDLVWNLSMIFHK